MPAYPTPLPRAPKKSGGRERKHPSVKDISNNQLADLIPQDCVEILCHGVPVLSDTRTGKLRLGKAFCQALHDRLDGIDFQPYSLFDPRDPRHVPERKETCDAGKRLSQWYTDAVQEEGILHISEEEKHPNQENPKNRKPLMKTNGSK